MRLKNLFACLALLPFAVSALAQGLPEPSKEINDLSWMLGTWTGKSKWNLPGMPEMDIEFSYTTEMDGPFMKTVNSMDVMGMTVKETMYLAYDAAQKRYSSWTFTNMSPMPRIEHGNMEGANFVMVGEPWDAGMGEPIVSRSTIVKKTDSESTFLLEFKTGDSWTKIAEGTFTKKKT